MATSLASVHPRGVDPKEAQIDVGGDDPEAVAASSLAPREAARRVPGGWRLSGHYPFSSGCDYAQWAIIGAFLGPKGDPWGVADLLVPLAEVEIVDDWQVLGLLGTGTKSLVLEDGFAPEHRSVMVSDLFAGTPPGASVHPEYLVLRAARGFLVSYSLPPVAIARPPRPRHRLCNAGHQSVTRGDPGGPVRGRADGDRRGRRGDRLATLLFHTGREAGTAAVNSVPRLDPRIMR